MSQEISDTCHFGLASFSDATYIQVSPSTINCTRKCSLAAQADPGTSQGPSTVRTPTAKTCLMNYGCEKMCG